MNYRATFTTELSCRAETGWAQLALPSPAKAVLAVATPPSHTAHTGDVELKGATAKMQQYRTHAAFSPM